MSTTSACEGLRVIELSGSPAGSLVGMIFSDNGADVVLVEPPLGSASRGEAAFLMVNRGKRSMELDLVEPDGRRRLIELAGEADIIISSWRPGVATRLGVDSSTLCRHHPALIYGEISGFGRIESLAEVQGYEHVVSAAVGKMGELDDISGKASSRPDDVPAFTAAPANTYGAANLAVQGILAALLERDRSGVGQVVATSLFDGAFATHLMRKDMRRGKDLDDHEREKRFALRHRGVRLSFLTVACKDGRYIQMCARQEHHFRNWLKAIGLRKVLEEPRFEDVPLGFKSFADADELEGLIREKMNDRTQEEWMRIFIEEVDVGADPFLTFEEFLSHPQMLANDRVIEIDDPVVGRTKQLGPLVLAFGTPTKLGASAPQLNADRNFAWSTDVRAVVDPGAPRASSGPLATGKDGPLKGITILELATYVAGPWASAILAELGARVIKVEPISGDSYRRSGTFVHLAHGKESVALDLKNPVSTELLHELIRRSDVLLENYRPGVPERLGFDYPTVKEIAPGLVYVYGASYGSRGPQSHRAAFHSTPNALCGGGILQGGEGNPPVDDSFPDPCSAVAAATAIMLGLSARRITGLGQYLETSMLSSAGYVYAEELVDYPTRPARHHVDHEQMGYDALYRLYQTADGWMFIGVKSDAEWMRLVDALGRPAWLTEDRFADRGSRALHNDELAVLLGQHLLGGEAEEWLKQFRAADVAAVPVDPERGFAAFLVEEGYVSEGDHPEFGSYWKNLPLLSFSRSTVSVGEPCGLGEHTDRVLTELGYSAAAIRAMSEDGVVFLGNQGESTT